MLLLRQNRDWLQQIKQDNNRWYELIEVMTRYNPDERPTFLQLADSLALTLYTKSYRHSLILSPMVRLGSISIAI